MANQISNFCFQTPGEHKRLAGGETISWFVISKLIRDAIVTASIRHNVTSSCQDCDKIVTSWWHGHGCSSLVCVWLTTNGPFPWRSIPIGQWGEGKYVKGRHLENEQLFKFTFDYQLPLAMISVCLVSEGHKSSILNEKMLWSSSICWSKLAIFQFEASGEQENS